MDKISSGKKKKKSFCLTIFDQDAPVFVSSDADHRGLIVA